MLLTLVCMVGAFYFVFLQYYILLVEVLLYALTLVLLVFELLISFACFWQFKNYEKQQWHHFPDLHPWFNLRNLIGRASSPINIMLRRSSWESNNFWLSPQNLCKQSILSPSSCGRDTVSCWISTVSEHRRSNQTMRTKIIWKSCWRRSYRRRRSTSKN